MHLADPERRRDGGRAAAIVARHEYARDAARRQRRDRVAGARLHGVAESDRETRGASARISHEIVLPARAAARASSAGAAVMPEPSRQRVLPSASNRPPTRFHAASGHRTGIGGDGRRYRTAACGQIGIVRGDHGARERMVALALHRRRERERVVMRHVDRFERGHGWLAFGQRAGLVERDHGRALREFERLRILDQHAVPGRDARAGHDRGGRREAERARARDDEHRDRVEDRGFGAGAGDQPADQRQQGDAEDRRHEHSLTRSTSRWIGALGLRGFDEADDACERRPRADRGGFDDERAFAVDRAGRDGVAVVLRHGRLSPVISDSSMCERPDTIRPSTGTRSPGRMLTGADAYLRQRHVALDAVLDDARAVGTQRVQRADRVGGLALRARLEPLAEAHQRDDDGRRLEIQVAGMQGSRSSIHRLSPYAADVPSATSRSMLPVRAFTACQAAR